MEEERRQLNGQTCWPKFVFGMERSTSAPHLYKSKGKTSQQVVLSVHMDDVHGSGPRDKLEALVAFLRTKLHVKFADVLGDSEVKDEYVHLRRSRVATKGRCWVRPKQEHFRRMAEPMSTESCNSPTDTVDSER